MPQAVAALKLSEGLALASAVFSGIGAISQGQAAESQAQADADRAAFQSTVTRQQATREREVSAAEEEDFRRRQSAILAQRRAALGGAGVDIGTGTPLLAAGDFAAEAELQALRIRSGGETRSTRLEQEAQLTDLSGQSALARGKSAKQRGFLRAGSSLLTGAGTAFG